MTAAIEGEAPRNDVGTDATEALRARVDRFKLIRSARRPLPLTATEIERTEHDDALATKVYESLKPLVDDSAYAALPFGELAERLEGIDVGLDRMADALLDRLDRIPFAELRAGIPRAVETHRGDVLGLVDLVVADRDRLTGRLSVLEYLITTLSTEDVGHDRKIVHDPVELTPSLARIAIEQETSDETEAVALALFQADRTTAEGSDLEWLRSMRARKEALGLSRLEPNVLRAVVTYNARVFNRLAAAAEGDPLLEAMIEDTDADADGEGARSTGFLDDSDEIWARVGVPEDADSLFEHAGLESVLEALQMRLGGAESGEGNSYRVALALDVDRLESLEIEAIRSTDRDDVERTVAYSAVVGLILRDVGIVRSHLVDLGIVESTLSHSWLFEIEQALGKLISAMVTDANRYELTSSLSNIKAKHFLAPLQRMRERNPTDGADEGPDGAEADRPGETPEPSRKTARVSQASSKPASESTSFLHRLREAAAGPQARSLVLVPLVAMLAIFFANRIATTPTDVETMGDRALAKVSPYLASAYRNERGAGAIVIGRVDADYAKLPTSRRRAVARELIGALEADGVREILVYGPRGRMVIHSVNGRLRRPSPDGG